MIHMDIPYLLMAHKPFLGDRPRLYHCQLLSLFCLLTQTPLLKYLKKLDQLEQPSYWHCNEAYEFCKKKQFSQLNYIGEDLTEKKLLKIIKIKLINAEGKMSNILHLYIYIYIMYFYCRRTTSCKRTQGSLKYISKITCKCKWINKFYYGKYIIQSHSTGPIFKFSNKGGLQLKFQKFMFVKAATILFPPQYPHQAKGS